MSRTLRRLLSTSFVSHAYAAHAHQIDASTSSPRSSPAQDRSSREPRGDLGEREDEDEVEEQLERLDPLVGIWLRRRGDAAGG